MKSASPYLIFPGNTEEAFNFYKSVFGGEFSAVLRFRDFGDNHMGVSEADLDKVAHIALPLGKDNILMGNDVVGPQLAAFKAGNNNYIMLDTDSKDEATEVFRALSTGGTIEMALQKTEWAEEYGMVADKFGVQWMVNYTGSVLFGAE